MKSFSAPMMTVVPLAEENIMCDSHDCPPHICNGFYCPDCIQCPGGYNCFRFECNEKYSG